MPSFCAVLDCKNKYGHKQLFHKFPKKNPELLEKWIEFTQRPRDWRPSKWMSVCGYHFRDEDYRCLEQKKLLKKTAVPCVRTSEEPNENEINKELEDEETTSNITLSGNSITKKINCRLCAFVSHNFVSFAGNFEIFGMIQKCLPTFSIRQDDNMPKEICGKCFKRLEEFSNFIDKVLETQTTLLHQYNYEKTNSKPSERNLKIKQEPVVRVKQENLDDLNSFFPDEIDDGCGEHDHDVSNTESEMEQKFQFCDFPVLNDQDIINNCDIMEIINLSEPFIDITNCENTIAEEEHHQARQQQYSQKNANQICQNIKQPPIMSAHDLLQTHLIMEEHNYANLVEGCKDEWQQRNCKTEKIDIDELGSKENIMDNTNNDTVLDLPLHAKDLNMSNSEVAATLTVTTTTNSTFLPFSNDALSNDDMERSNKPIVTSISNVTSVNNINDTVIATMPCEPSRNLFSEKVSAQTTSRKKPNIVVLNESIVQSSQAFQFQACTMCPSKFFCIDSLNHHYSVAHSSQFNMSMHTIQQPMVSVPTSNLTILNKTNTPEINLENQCYKVEKDFEYGNIQNYDKKNFTTNAQIENTMINKKNYKNEIKILDMQQTFPTQHYPYENYRQAAQQKDNMPIVSNHYQSQQAIRNEYLKDIEQAKGRKNLNGTLSTTTDQFFTTRKKQERKKVRSRGSHSKLQSHSCSQCEKVFPSLSSLNQHRITHTNMRLHQCDICQRIFKRRHGLSQHMRGYHLKLKPFECPTCKHKYALKGDMRRCGHSTLFCRKKSEKNVP